MEVDKVVDYPLCNDEWSGTVYVNCEAQVAQAKMDADANPLFLKGCNLNIAPNTVVCRKACFPRSSARIAARGD